VGVSPLTDEEVQILPLLRDLRFYASEVKRRDTYCRRVVGELRKLHVSWGRIASCVGTTRQAAQTKYGRHSD
jgi:hypothetical protein